MVRRRSQGFGPEVDGREQHRDWLSLVEVDGPFLTLPVLTRVWPTLEAVDSATRGRLADAHTHAAVKPRAWVEFVVEDLLGWASLVTWGPTRLDWTDAEHGVTVGCDFALGRPIDPRQPSDPRQPGQQAADVGAEDVYLLGFVVDDEVDPRGRVAGDDWAATRTDRAAAACRGLDVPLALVTNGRLWSLVWAPRGGVTTVVTFDTVTWTEAADRVVVRAFVSLLGRLRFTSVADSDQLPALLRESLAAQEEVTEELGRGVRRAVEQLVEAMGRWDARETAVGRAGLADVGPHEAYSGAVRFLMRLVFLLFAEERRLLPSDVAIYADGYGASTLCERLEADAQDAGEEALEHRTGAWLQLLATSTAVYRGVRSARLTLPAYDGSLFNPGTHPWLAQISIDDRTVLHVLRAVQFVQIKRERRRVSFRALQVEQIGYVYEGLLAYEATRADHWVLGLIGKSGSEEEVPLPVMEGLLARHTDLDSGVFDHDSLAVALAERFKDSGIGSVRKLTGLLVPPTAAERTGRRQRLLAVTEGDQSLAERILPLAGLLRDDLRGLPAVIPAGALYVTASAARAKSGTHYTPRDLAEEVTQTALMPLVYGTPGPLDTDDEPAWTPATSGQILTLKVADIAMGSGAFLVAACRFLGDRLVAAWAREGDRDAADHIERRGDEDGVLRVDGVEPEIVTRARRLVIEHCLYGSDINPMAVEMAKLSLWLVSMDPGRPFTFLDDRLVSGDSLLGIANLDQLESLHMNAAAGRRIHGKWVKDPTAGLRGLLADLASERRALAEMPGETLTQLDAKRERLEATERLRWRADLLADLVVSSFLVNAPGGKVGLKIASKDLGASAEDLIDQPADSSIVREASARAEALLRFGLEDDADDRVPLHWPLRFPEVFEAGGFDAIIGNPPFLGGQKLTGSLGECYREYLVYCLGRSVRGSADLVAYFVLRAHELLNHRGQTGLIATNTLAQGDTRQVGLDQLEAEGITIKAAIKSEPWPSRSAVLQYCAVWTSRTPLAAGVGAVLERRSVGRITTALDPGSRASGQPHRLAANAGVAFQGSIILGLGFTMESDRAQRLIEADARNAEVLFPYLNGQDLNSRPDGSASRWVINFHDWSEERARSYPSEFAQIERLVKHERLTKNDAGAQKSWWRFLRPRPEMQAEIAGLDRIIAITLVSKVVMPVMVRTGQVFSHMLGVFASDDAALFSLLSSAPHYWWAIERSSTLETRIRYTPTDVFESFARPEPTVTMRHLGDRLDRERRDLMLARQAGLTATYNLVHNPANSDADIVALRELHRDIDEAVFAAYGWTDLSPVHDHFQTRQGVRWTIDPDTRQEMLDRLLELNQERYAAEQGTTSPAEVAHDDGRLF